MTLNFATLAFGVSELTMITNASRLYRLRQAIGLVEVAKFPVDLAFADDDICNSMENLVGNEEFCETWRQISIIADIVLLGGNLAANSPHLAKKLEDAWINLKAKNPNLRNTIGSSKFDAVEGMLGVGKLANHPKLLTKLNELEGVLPGSKAKFLEDFDEIAILAKFDENPGWVEAWGRFKNTSLSGDIKWLEFFSNGKIGKNPIPKGWKISEAGGVTTIKNTQGKLLAEFDGTTLKCPGGDKGKGWNTFLNIDPPLAKVKYDVDGYIYETDEFGRVIKVSGDLDDVVRARLNSQQIRSVDIKEGTPSVDQGGHAIAARFYGPGEQINYYPQAAKLNQGAWKEMENEWARALVAGEDVKIQILPKFSGSSKRPIKFAVRYKTGNNDPVIETFDNF